MIPAIATVCLSGTLREKLEAIAAAGFTELEIFENDLIAFPGSPAEVRRICGDLGLRIITVQPFRDFEGMPDARRAKTFDRAERKLDLMGELGCDLLFVCSSVAPDALPGMDRLAADFRELGERAAKRGMRVGFEALAWGRHVGDYRDAWEIVRRADHPSVGLILDSFHVLARDLDLATIRNVPKDRLFFVQIADAPRLQMDPLSWSRHWRCMPGQGDLDLASFMDALAVTGYDGPVSLEIFNDRFRAGSARAVAVDGRRSLFTLIDDAGKRAGRKLGPVPDMPPRATVKGVEFIEFAVDENERPGFEGLLRGLGFAATGRHRSKEVSLWEQGAIRIVVNSDREGFAHSYNLNHGTSVCAMALKVPDARATLERAKAILEQPYSGAIGPGELDIPAVRGLGGSLVYFVDDVSSLGRWSELDFLPTGEKAEGIGLTAVDHVSQSMQYEEMLTWLLFYTSLIEARKSPTQAVIDPGGVVQSQVIESGVAGDAPGAGLRLVLNGSQSHRTLAARFVTDFFGSGVQHIALDATDIFAAVEKMTARGVEILDIPDNYYDDLEARFDLPADLTARMRRFNVLYDRDERGPFYQAYTTTLEGGFFFEIVQRDGYAGYGGPNAGIRLAAQARLARPTGMPSR
jgi:4-hydroxyphenylpyruvate dioxygenase